MRALFAVVLSLVAGCGSRALDLSLTFDPTCHIAVGGGGSILYEVSSAGGDGGIAPRVCSGCLAVDAPLADAPTLLQFLREHAPSCPIARESSIRVTLTSFIAAGCNRASAGAATDRVCADSEVVYVGDGRADRHIDVPLSCAAGCDSAGCVPTGCLVQGKNCGPLSNGCGETLDCGTCKPPEKCGGGGVSNICGR